MPIVAHIHFESFFLRPFRGILVSSNPMLLLVWRYITFHFATACLFPPRNCVFCLVICEWKTEASFPWKFLLFYAVFIEFVSVNDFNTKLNFMMCFFFYCIASWGDVRNNKERPLCDPFLYDGAGGVACTHSGFNVRACVYVYLCTSCYAVWGVLLFSAVCVCLFSSRMLRWNWFTSLDN